MNIQIVIMCGPCEAFVKRCIQSLQAQDDPDWDARVIVDPCGDKSFEAASEAAARDGRFHLHQNLQRMYSMFNLIQAIRLSEAGSEDVIVVVDGDDWLNQTDAIRKIRSTYAKHDCWLTYGSWISNVPHIPGMWSAYPHDIRDFRMSPWLATGIRTWKKWLWDLVDDEDFRDEHGRYFRYASDVAYMLPMLEMSGTRRSVHIPEPLLFYNRANPHCEQEVAKEGQFRNALYTRCKKPYPRLDRRRAGPVAPQNDRQEVALCATSVQLVSNAIGSCARPPASLEAIVALVNRSRSSLAQGDVDARRMVAQGVDVLTRMGIVELHRDILHVAKGAEARLALYRMAM